MARHLLERLGHHFGQAVLETRETFGNEVAVVDKSRLVDMAQFLRDERDLALTMPIDCTAVDHMGLRTPRFDVSWMAYSPEHGHRMRLVVLCDEQNLEVPSLTPIWPGMNWHEREAWDLYGVKFVGHPDLRRVLMYDEFVGHPLRRDYPIDRRQPLIPLRKVRDVPTQRHPPPELLNRP